MTDGFTISELIDTGAFSVDDLIKMFKMMEFCGIDTTEWVEELEMYVSKIEESSYIEKNIIR